MENVYVPNITYYVRTFSVASVYLFVETCLSTIINIEIKHVISFSFRQR